jgi:hypothetical protein
MFIARRLIHKTSPVRGGMINIPLLPELVRFIFILL